MPQLKIIVLAHPAVWTDSVEDVKSIERKIANLIEKGAKSKSWINIDGELGKREGIYKLGPLKDSRYVAKIVYEREIKEEYQSVEEILREDNCLPEEYKVPTPVPTASKATLFFDLKEGICYVYTDTMSPPLETISSILIDFGADCGLQLSELRHFAWEEELVTTITKIAVDEGFNPYKVRADLETVKVTAEGIFSDNEDWERIRNSIDLGRWKTIAFVKSREGKHFVFGMSKQRRKQLTMPYLSDLNNEELFEEILNMRRLIEKALGCDVRQYCFPEKITPITHFFKKKPSSRRKGA